MAEKHYAFIKDGHVDNIAVFAAKDDALAQTICTEQGYDSFVWLDEAAVPHKHSSYDGTTFTEPTLDYLYSIGIQNENSAMRDARIAEEAAKAAENATPTA
jgi:hypothetical protein